MNTFTWKSIRRIRHTDEMRSILEVVLNSYLFFYFAFKYGFPLAAGTLDFPTKNIRARIVTT